MSEMTAFPQGKTYREVLLCKCGEMVLKGLNKSFFENNLLRTIRRRLEKVGDFEVTSQQSTVYVAPVGPQPVLPALDVCKKIFGIVSLSRALVCEKDMGDIVSGARAYLAPLLSKCKTFKVEAKRSDKRFPKTSPQISSELGGELLSAFPFLSVDVHDPDVIVMVEIRETNAYVHAGAEKGAGGIPMGTSGKGLLLLSGGIDSPVAGYMMAKRGLCVDAIHFNAFPYTGEAAKEKAVRLACLLSEYSGSLNLRIASVTAIQETIRDSCDEEYFTILLRRMMMRIADRVAEKTRCSALITGESLGQVASQTLEGLCVTDPIPTRPVFRPCIGMDKEEIVTLSRRIGSFDISVLPYEDCCTVFTPRHPKTKPEEAKVEAQEEKIDVASLVETSVSSLTSLRVSLGEVVGEE